MVKKRKRRTRKRTVAQKEAFATRLRENLTGSEKLLWGRMCAVRWPNGVKWESQSVVMGFIPDFWEPLTRIVVEVDGGIHNLPRVKRADARKDRIFRKAGITVFRFTNEETESGLPRIVQLLRREVLLRATDPQTPPGRKSTTSTRTRRRVYGRTQDQEEIS